MGKLDKPRYTFDDLMLRWIEEKNPGRSDIYSIAALNKILKGQQLNQINGQTISDIKNIWSTEGVSSNTIRRRLNSFSSAINYARKEWEWDIENPVSCRLPAVEEYEADHLTYEQARRFVNALKKRSSQPYNAPHLFDFFVLAVNTGMRKNEILSCRLDQIDLDNQCIHLKRMEQKNRKRTATPLNKSAMKVINRRLSFIKKHFPNSTWLFPNALRKGEIHIKDVKRSFKTLCKEVGCGSFRIHDLRHTFASWLIQEGEGIFKVSKALRHSSITPTQRYTHLELEDLRKTHEAIDVMPIDFDLDTSEEETESDSFQSWKRSLTKNKRECT